MGIRSGEGSYPIMDSGGNIGPRTLLKYDVQMCPSVCNVGGFCDHIVQQEVELGR